MKNILIIISFLIGCCKINGQTDTSQVKNYDFIIMDSPAKLFTMRQFDQDYISLYRIASNQLNKAIENKRYVALVEVSLGILFLPLTHEEGHRSILTALNIGSISQPFFNSKGVAIVSGVTDQQLKNLRDNDLPDYIRLHTAGLEADYALTKKVESLCAFEEDDFKNLKWEYLFRKLAILQYYVSGLFHYNSDINEDADELKRDIVGFDTYGAIRHLNRPEMDFYRYTKYDDLTGTEKDFVKRIGYRSLLNLINPLIVGKDNFTISDSVKLNFGFGYTMVPFGDMVEENIWLLIHGTKVQINLNQFENKNSWFWGGGIGILDYPVCEKIKTSFAFNVWNQPKDLCFDSKEGKFGYSFELDAKYELFRNNSAAVKSLSLNLGFINKSSGFLLEEVYLSKHTGFRIGTSLGL
jgi:hypothetical protein